MSVTMIIAIDGPAASGKSTTAKIIADRLDLLYLDTGAMYRAVALYLSAKGIDSADENALRSALEDIDIYFQQIDGSYHIFLNAVDVSSDIRVPHITKMSSEVACIREVRERMVEMQREIAGGHDVILDGRDIGTVVFPNADYKFYLTASLDSRALRRFKEQHEKGIDCDLSEIRVQLAWRDENDSQRAFAPLKKADDAIEIDTTHLSIDQQVEGILQVITATTGERQ